MSQLPDRLSVIINAPITVADHTLTVLHFYLGSVMIRISEINLILKKHRGHLKICRISWRQLAQL